MDGKRAFSLFWRHVLDATESRAAGRVYDRVFESADVRRIVAWFNDGHSLRASDQDSVSDLTRAFARVPGLRGAAEEAPGVDASDAAELVSACELLLEGLYSKRLISRSEQLGYTRAQSERTERRGGSRSWSESSGIN